MKTDLEKTNIHSFERSLIDNYCHNTDLLENKKHRTKLHIALIVKRGQILAESSNYLGFHFIGPTKSNSTIHAEIAVVKKLGDLQKLRGADLYVFRVGINENHGSHPCPSCSCFLRKCMDQYGLRNVYYNGEDFNS